jgi:hypothetical protein
MSPVQVEDWIALIDVACQQASTDGVDVILDQAGMAAPLLPSVLSVQPAMPWHSLFTGLPEEALADVGPLLVRIDLAQPFQRHWLIGLLRSLPLDSQPLMLISQWPFEALATHLTQCLDARNGRFSGLLRYYDPRVFAVLFSHVLRAEQQQPWLRPALLWSWLDRDGTPQHLTGCSDTPQSPQPFGATELSTRQLGMLSCVSDVARMLKRRGHSLPVEQGDEQRFQLCYAAMLQACEERLSLDCEREAFVCEQVRNA